jgi:hypothetical protein
MISHKYCCVQGAVNPPSTEVEDVLVDDEALLPSLSPGSCMMVVALAGDALEEVGRMGPGRTTESTADNNDAICKQGRYSDFVKE